MSKKLTPKQEKFCQSYIETGNASEAYRRAYEADNMKPETINRKAKEALDNGKITARIEELQAEHRKCHDISVEILTDELETARSLALLQGDPKAMISATMGKAKLHGLITNVHSGPGGGPIPVSHTITPDYSGFDDEFTGE